MNEMKHRICPICTCAATLLLFASFGASFAFFIKPCHRQRRAAAATVPLVPLSAPSSQFQFSTPIELNLSSVDSIDDNNDDADSDGDGEFNFMASLKGRIAEVKNQDTSCPLVVLDCMLPRQVLRVRLDDPQVVKVVRRQLANETPTFGMRGTMKLNKKNSFLGNGRGREGEEVRLTNGVEVEIMQKPHFIQEGVLLILRAKRRFTVISEVENTEQGWVDANVKYLDSKEQEEEELLDDEDGDQMCIQRAILKAAELTSLIDRWIELARGCEKRPGQIDMLLGDIGHVPPPSTEPSERAFWVGALINPLPEMGVATGIRPDLIMAKTAQERVDIAYNGIVRSIAHMDGSDPLW